MIVVIVIMFKYNNLTILNIFRFVLERAISHKLNARKMKFLFKKWIELEEKFGDQDKIEKVRQMALEYIEKVTDQS